MTEATIDLTGESDGNVVDFPGPTRLDIPVERVLQKALAAGLSEVAVIGFREDGGFYFAASKADGANVLWSLKIAERRLLLIGDPQEAQS